MKETNKQYPEYERRQYHRIDSANVIKCKNFTTDDLFAENISLDIAAITKNISACGVLFESDCKFGVGELLKIEMNFPGWEEFKTEF